MPPRKRAETFDEHPSQTPDAPEKDDSVAGLAAPESEQTDTPKRGRPPKTCPDCFPDGWPAGVTGLGCEHGSWQR